MLSISIYRDFLLAIAIPDMDIYVNMKPNKYLIKVTLHMQKERLWEILIVIIRYMYLDNMFAVYTVFTCPSFINLIIIIVSWNQWAQPNFGSNATYKTWRPNNLMLTRCMHFRLTRWNIAYLSIIWLWMVTACFKLFSHTWCDWSEFGFPISCNFNCFYIKKDCIRTD